jgi:LemA protein
MRLPELQGLFSDVLLEYLFPPAVSWVAPEVVLEDLEAVLAEDRAVVSEDFPPEADSAGDAAAAGDRGEVSNIGGIKMEQYNKPWVWIVGIIVLLIVITIGSYNGLVGRNQDVNNAWAQVENQLQRRNDLIPNLVATVKGYATHEKSIFIQVAEARTKLAGAISRGSQSEKIKAANNMDSALSRLLAIAENYPNLKASENFRMLQDQLEGTENRIATERMRFNDAVRSYNTSALRFPTVLFVNLFGFDRSKTYFEAPASAKQVPNVKF